MRSRLAALLASLALIAGAVVGLAPSAAAAIPPCGYGNYFDSAGRQIRATPVQTVGSQAGKAWCVGFSVWVYPSRWASNQRLYEITTGR